ncbi:DNA-binding protein, putative [uncultured Candidatus Thioglobus sp.]|nr:DNA-binding protein, putative [uncultured Candidatus Thioglobus sp.]SMN02330.1 DNA-binding protein, putative [uncultured Candidatus Thioglobus sp.]
MNRVNFKDFKAKALQNPEVKEAYDLLEDKYQIIDMLISMRKNAGLTQDEIALAMHTNKSNISRLESFNYKSSPKISTLSQYAQATGHKLEIGFVRQ